MKSNPDKCHLLLASRNSSRINIEVHTIYSSAEEKLFGVKSDSLLLCLKLMYLDCKKASQKLHTLSRIAKYLDHKKHENA